MRNHVGGHDISVTPAQVALANCLARAERACGVLCVLLQSKRYLSNGKVVLVFLLQVQVQIVQKVQVHIAQKVQA